MDIPGPLNLTWLGCLELSADTDDRGVFGGISGVYMHGSRLLMVSDASKISRPPYWGSGHIFAADVRLEPATVIPGAPRVLPVSLENVTAQELRTGSGDLQESEVDGDLESLDVEWPKEALVGFDFYHVVRRYRFTAPVDRPGAAVQLSVPEVVGMKADRVTGVAAELSHCRTAGDNAGAQSLALMPGGLVFIFCELGHKGVPTSQTVGWLANKETGAVVSSYKLALPAVDGSPGDYFRIAAAAAAPALGLDYAKAASSLRKQGASELLLLFHYWSASLGHVNKIARVTHQLDAPSDDVLLRPVVLLTLSKSNGYPAESFQAMSAVPSGLSGSYVLHLVSDNNFNFAQQRTLLLSLYVQANRTAPAELTEKEATANQTTTSTTTAASASSAVTRATTASQETTSTQTTAATTTATSSSSTITHTTMGTTSNQTTGTSTTAPSLSTPTTTTTLQVTYSTMPGNGFCGDANGLENTARDLSGGLSCEVLKLACDEDAACVAYACANDTMSGVIYSSTGCRFNCDNTAWLTNPGLITQAIGGSLAGWATGFCAVKQEPTAAPSSTTPQVQGHLRAKANGERNMDGIDLGLYVKISNIGCGDCSSNDVFIGANEDRWALATREEALKTCGDICKGHKDCGGFSYVNPQGKCYFRKNTNCNVFASDDFDCYAVTGRALDLYESVIGMHGRSAQQQLHTVATCAAVATGSIAVLFGVFAWRRQRFPGQDWLSQRGVTARQDQSVAPLLD